MLQKLVAVGGAVEQESFEVQVKAPAGQRGAGARRCSTADELTVIRSSRYHQYDTYWSFDDPDQGRLRYREDEFLDEAGRGHRRAIAADAHRPDARGPLRRRAALPLALPGAGRALGALLPRVLPAGRRARREKERRRWLVAYRGVEFYVHLDRLIEPAAEGYFLEIKSRTWSRRDARDKAAIIAELLALFGATPDDTLGDGYVELAARGGVRPE